MARVCGRARLNLALATAAAACALGASPAHGASTWRLEQPPAPEPPAGVAPAPGPIGLGHIGAISFAPCAEGPPSCRQANRGVLITAGKPPTIPAGIWIYNGTRWRELTRPSSRSSSIGEVCGASDGRIAWASPNEFWTISDGRPGQADVNGRPPPLVDDTLCRFADGKILESFAAPGYEADSYMPMHALACLGPENCWFGGAALPEQSTEIGAFQLQWNGALMSAAPYDGEAHAIEELQEFDGRLYESVQLQKSDAVVRNTAVPPALHVLDPEISSGFQPEGELGRDTLYGRGEQPWALNYLHLSAGAGGLWAAAGERPESGESAEVTVLRFTPEAGGEWTQLVGPDSEPSGASLFPEQTVAAIATEPGSSEAGEETSWLALEPIEEALEAERGTPRASSVATVVRVSANGGVSAAETLPSPIEEKGIGPKGAAEKLICPAAGDCWLATSEGYLFHLAPENERTLPEDTTTPFPSIISERPADKGLPQTQPDSLPVDDSGIVGELPQVPTVVKPKRAEQEFRVPVALVSKVHTRVVHGTTLEMRFHLAVKARIKLEAKRKHRLVASSPMYTFKAGSRKILLRLERKRWPTELHLLEHPLAPLPTVSGNAGSTETVVTSSLAFPAHLLSDPLGQL